MTRTPERGSALSIINQFALAMLETTEPEHLLWAIADNVGSIMGFEDCVLYLRDGNVLKQVAAFGVKTSERKVLNKIEISIGEGIVGTVAKTGQGEIVKDTRKDRRYIYDQFSGLSELTVPVRYGDEVIGIFDIECAEADGFSREDLFLLQTIANIAAPRIKSAEYQQSLNDAQVKLSQSNESLKDKVATLERNQQSLVQAEKMASIGQLASGIAHEINTPLGFSLSNLETARNYTSKIAEFVDSLIVTQRGKLPVGITEFVRVKNDLNCLLEETMEGLTDLKDIVADLRSVSRTQSLELVTCDVNETLKKTLSVYKNMYHGRITIETIFVDDATVSGNPGKLHQVFGNLLVNAVQAIPEEGCIKIVTSKHANRLHISFEDSGNGISQSDIPNVFTPFFTTKPAGEGVGLGLSICYSIIVEDHGGDLTVKSKPGCTTFKIELPAG